MVCVVATAAPAAQEVRRGGPPPEVRAVFDALLQAVNGGSEEAWEAFAQARFSPSFLQEQSRDERAKLYNQIVTTFGVIAIQGVRREGPDAPLQMNVKGSKADGMIVLTLSTDSPPRIDDLRLGSDAPPSADAGGAGRPPIDRSMTSAEIDRRLDGYFTKLAADDNFSGVALVARNGVPVFFKAYGLADREKKVANTIRTRFNLGSINKAFTQVAVHQLVAAGKLSYSDTIGKFYPDYPQAASRSARWSSCSRIAPACRTSSAPSSRARRRRSSVPTPTTSDSSAACRRRSRPVRASNIATAATSPSALSSRRHQECRMRSTWPSRYSRAPR